MENEDHVEIKSNANDLTLKMNYSNSVTASLLVADASASIGNTYCLGFKTVTNWVLETIHGITFNLGYNFTLKARASNYQEFFSNSSKEGSITLSSMSSTRVSADRIAFLAGCSAGNQAGLGTAITGGSITKGDFRAKSINSSTEIKASEKIAFCAGNGNNEGSITITSDAIEIKMPDGKDCAFSAAGSYNGDDNHNTSSNALTVGGNAITVKADADTSVSADKNGITMKAGKSAFKLTGNSISILNTNTLNLSGFDITLKKKNQLTAARAALTDARLNN